MNAASAFLVLGLALPSFAAPRPPQAADRFYPADRKLLDKFLDRAFARAGSPKVDGRVVALVVPHAGVEYSGATAAKAYSLLQPGSFDRVIIVGTGHYKALDGAALYPGDYATPDVTAPYDRELAEALMKASPLIKADAEAHQKEHSIEVQLPFLKRRLGAFSLVALVMNTQDLDAARRIGRAIAAAAKGKRVLIIASSDMSHYPKGADADRVDPTTLAALETMDPSYFWLTNRFLMNRGVPDLAVTWCGEGAVTAVLEAARALGATSAAPLARINSGDVVSEREYKHVVGYSAVAFVKGPAPARGPLDLSAKEKKDLVALARKSLETFFTGGRAPAVPLSADPLLNLPAATFVTLTKAGRLRGCVGATSPQESLAESVEHEAIDAATRDPRFPAVTAAELPSLALEVSVLGPSRAVSSFEEIAPGDGVALENGAKTGVFLPDAWKDLPQKNKFLSELCRQKAGLAADCYKDPTTRLRTFSALVIKE